MTWLRKAAYPFFGPLLQDWRYYDGSLYVFRARLDTFANQEAWCQDVGGHLASVTSPEENAFIYNLRPVASFSRWIGGRITTRSPFALQWIDGTTYVDFSTDAVYDGCKPSEDCLFQKNEPNNFFGNEDCISQAHPIQTSNAMGWNDASCSQEKYAVCEKPGKMRLALGRLQKGFPFLPFPL